MIIKHPTGLFANMIPRQPQDGGNVTWVMSGEPPSLTQIFPKLPPGIGNKRRAPSEITIDERRSALGGIIYSTTSTSRTELGSATKQYNTGQLLSFDDQVFDDQVNDAPTALPLPNATTDIQHGLNRLDYTKLGLTGEQQAAIESASTAAYSGLQTMVATAREQYLRLQVLINEDQKVVNETNTAIAALRVLASTSPAIAVMLETLGANLAAAQDRIATHVVEANAKTAEINGLQDQLNNLAQLVR